MKVGGIGFFHGYDPDNIELDRINTEIMLLIQKFIFVTKHFIPSNSIVILYIWSWRLE